MMVPLENHSERRERASLSLMYVDEMGFLAYIF